MLALAPLLARAIGLPEATDVVRAMAVLVLIRGLSVGPGAILERELDFRARAKEELAGAAAQLAVAIGLAVAGFGVWSLVAGHLVAAVVQGAVFWLILPWRPRPRQASFRVWRELVRYGKFVTAGNLLQLFNRSVDEILVARLLGATALGFYAVTYRLADFPTSVIGHVVGRVMFPAYARIRDDPKAFRHAFVQNLQRVALLALPIAVALLVAAEPVVLALLGPKWLDVVDPLRILALFTIVRSFASPCGAVFQGAGKPHLVPLWFLPRTLTIVPALLLLVPRFGVSGAALAMLVAVSASGLPALAVALRLLELRVVDLLRALAPSLASAAAFAAALSLLVRATDGMPAPASLAALASVGALLYAGTTLLLARSIVMPMWISLRESRG